MLLINIYNSPSVDKLEFLTSLNNLLLELSQFNDSIMMTGDLNINLLEKSSSSILVNTTKIQKFVTVKLNQLPDAGGGHKIYCIVRTRTYIITMKYGTSTSIGFKNTHS